MRALEAEHARLSRFPATDVFADGTIMAWSKLIPSTGVNYSYAAIRGNDLWWVTGSTSGGSRGRTYDELLNFIGDGTNVRVIDPDVGLELDELVIDEGDDGRPWRNRVKEVRNAVADQLFTTTAAEVVTANPPAGMIMRDDGTTADNSGGWCMPTDTSLTSPESER